MSTRCPIEYPVLPRKLLNSLGSYIHCEQITPLEKAAKFFCMQQPKISNIMSGKVDEISSDYLVDLQARTDGEFRYSFKQPSSIQQNLPPLLSVFLVRNPPFVLNIVPILVQSVSVQA